MPAPPPAPDIPRESGVVRLPDSTVRLVAWQIFSETDKAVMVGRQHTFRSEAQWLPKSQIRSRTDLPSEDGPQLVTLIVTAWIAKEKNFA